MIKTKVAFLEGRLLFSQSEQSERKKPALQKSHFYLDHVNRLIVYCKIDTWNNAYLTKSTNF